MTGPTLPTVLVFAGADPSGGAGIAADIVAIAAQGAHALPVITALTVQDNDRVFGVQPVAPEWLRRQALALIDKMVISAVKIGIPGSAANAAVIAQLIAQLRQSRPDLPVVLDPVLASGHGDVLSRDDAVLALAPLLPVTTVIVPNGPEALALGGEAALRAQGCGHVLVTGGHGEGQTIINRWFDAAGGEREWCWPRLPGEFHGSGCTLASAIAARLALGQALPEALDLAQSYCHAALAGAYAIAPGQLMPQRFIQ
ncbi:hydroxymethylpyrimidine/phosphomethylpyrimidine kinase [Janthinobacterium sp. HH103]|uniref:bifunctional hydroxymethylpyrimidine kinase/phosphomethylpyrimidine kinase n=1 Tax=unclassified Janthinobacterium TaxID=2610881 RepID=UPI0008932366|nr:MULTISPECIES: hydroxymethylpyrimidine/phosphomethylpyrimidine kinase [unclassified Janthinobacterium]OEZ67141.1 hydroxymethylpyrimidine/phosphomethylpyrimidine kinase [Janthinobacterium sp. HH100]OEZ71729.1 hydroxymethylpyrimidine/phosphomethylpyrimidine kinase [Janthinobacterium sp. HH103]QOU71665.1 Hydroxymethylpyrimidine/phosphomethylpyrimidine kinase [Janthinobacterium sp. HH102]